MKTDLDAASAARRQGKQPATGTSADRAFNRAVHTPGGRGGGGGSTSAPSYPKKKVEKRIVPAEASVETSAAGAGAAELTVEASRSRRPVSARGKAAGTKGKTAAEPRSTEGRTKGKAVSINVVQSDTSDGLQGGEREHSPAFKTKTAASSWDTSEFASTKGASMKTDKMKQTLGTTASAATSRESSMASFQASGQSHQQLHASAALAKRGKRRNSEHSYASDISSQVGSRDGSMRATATAKVSPLSSLRGRLIGMAS